MTANGLVLFALATTICIFVPSPTSVPIFALGVVTLFALFQGSYSTWRSLLFALKVVAPIAVLLAVIWIWLIGSSPDAMAPGARADGGDAVQYVVRMSSRLFVFALLLHATLASRLQRAPLAFLSELRLPMMAKQTVAMTLSIASTMRAAIDRAWIALVAANLVTPRRSLRNLRNGWLFLVSVWLFVVSAINDRLGSKWKIEDISQLLRVRFEERKDTKISLQDWLWLGLSSAATVLSIWFSIGKHLPT